MSKEKVEFIVNEDINGISMEELQAKHKKEKKELNNKLMAMKKEKSSASKAKKKEIDREMSALELELSEKHKSELKYANSMDSTTNNLSPNEPQIAKLSLHDSDPKPAKPKKKRKNKLVEEYEKQQELAKLEMDLEPNLREIESMEIDAKAKQMNLTVYDIRPDGHCLYNSIAHQWNLKTPENQLTYKDLRKKAADFMRQHQDSFLPFILDENGNTVDEEGFHQYCNDCENSSTWGGHNEVTEC